MEVIEFKDLGEVKKRLFVSNFILSDGCKFFVKWYLPEVWDAEKGDYVRGMRWATDKAFLIKCGLSKDEINKFCMDSIQGRWRKKN